MSQVTNSAYFDADTDTAESRNESLKALGITSTAVAGSLVAFGTLEPAHAQTASTTSLTDMLTDLGTLVGAAVVLGVLVMGAQKGFQIIRKSAG